MPLRVIVIGAGIGGLALAQALKAASTDIDVKVFERNRTATDWLQGYRININPHGTRSLHECLQAPLWEAFVATSVAPTFGITFRTEQLRELVTLGVDDMVGPTADPTVAQYGVSRVVLRRILLTGLDDIIRFDSTYERYTVDADGQVTAYFADGSTATGDVLVGADGANSVVREQYLPHAGRVDTDAIAIAGRLPLTEATRAWLPPEVASGMVLTQAPVARSMFTAAFAGRRQLTEALTVDLHVLAAAGIDPDTLLDRLEDYVLWSVIAHRKDYPPGAEDLDAVGHQALAAAMVRGWHPVLQRIVAEADVATVQHLPLKHSRLVEPWTSTQVTVIGDAIHNMSPVGGLGANTALRDAAELSRRLIAVRDRREVVAAIGAYESRMRDYGYAAVRESSGNTARAISTSRVARIAGRTWFRLCRTVPALKRRTFARDWSDSEGPRPEPARVAG